MVVYVLDDDRYASHKAAGTIYNFRDGDTFTLTTGHTMSMTNTDTWFLAGYESNIALTIEGTIPSIRSHEFSSITFDIRCMPDPLSRAGGLARTTDLTCNPRRSNPHENHHTSRNADVSENTRRLIQRLY